MRCYDCGGTYIEKHGDLHLHNQYIGDYTISSVNYNKCVRCGQLLFPHETIEKIEAEENKIKNQRIGDLPVKDFLSAAEASILLGISKQAFSKNTKIKNGFIYSVLIGGKRFYHRKSVLLFKENGDGRFEFNTNNNESLNIQPGNTDINVQMDYIVKSDMPFVPSDDYYLVESIDNVQSYC